MSPSALCHKRTRRAPYRGPCHGRGVHPAQRRVDLGMDELAARTSADAHAQAPVTTPVRRLARARVEKMPTGDIAHVQWVNPYRTNGHPGRTTGVEHLDGLPWYRTPLPVPVHDCWRQTWHTDSSGLLWLERCACGGTRVHQPDPGPWFGINSRATGRVLSASLIWRAVTRLRRKGRP